jgi:hypothetical protein
MTYYQLEPKIKFCTQAESEEAAKERFMSFMIGANKMLPGFEAITYTDVDNPKIKIKKLIF